MTAGTCAPAFGAADPRLPGRDVLLDDESMRQRLGGLLGVDGPVTVGEIRRVRAKYRPAESLRVVHSISVRGQAYLVASRMRASGADELYRDALTRAVACGPLHGVAFDEALQCVFWTFPNDRRLPVLERPLAQHSLVARLFAPRDVVTDVAGYAPERAVVYRLADAQAGCTLGFAKRFAPGGSREASARLDGLAAANRRAAAPVCVPRVLGEDAVDALLVVEALPGRHLHQLRPADLEPAFVALGAAMGRLHALPVPPELPFDDQCAATAMREAIALLSRARPDVAAAAARLEETLHALRPVAAAPVWIHGDLNSRNWLAQPERDDRSAGVSATGAAALIDLDQSTAGPAGVDVGGVLAWMRTRTLVGAWSATCEARLEAALLRGYARHRQVLSPAERCWYRAAALVGQRAARAATRVRLRQLAVLPEVLAAAARDLEALRHA